MGQKYDDDDEEITKTVLESIRIDDNDSINISHYEHIPETRADQMPEPAPKMPKDDD